MESFISKLPEYVQLISAAIGGLVFIATAVAKISSSKTMRTKATKVSEVLDMVVEKLPTFGTNPNTKKLKEELAKAKGVASADVK